MASLISRFTLSGILLPFSGNILQKSVNYFEGCMKDADNYMTTLPQQVTSRTLAACV